MTEWHVGVAIVHDGGDRRHVCRMDGVAPVSAEVAIGKARTSPMTRRPSKFFEDRVKARPAFANFPAGTLIQGAVPVIVRDECVGAIGVSGVASHEDEQIAKAGTAALA